MAIELHSDSPSTLSKATSESSSPSSAPETASPVRLSTTSATLILSLPSGQSPAKIMSYLLPNWIRLGTASSENPEQSSSSPKPAPRKHSGRPTY